MTNGSPHHAVRWRVLAVACQSVFMIVASLSALNVALAEIADALDAEIDDLQWIVDAYAITFAGLLLAGGAVGDRVGRRSAMAVGFAVFALANLACALSAAVGPVVAFRAIGGLGAALLMPASLAAVSEVFDDDGRPQAIAVWASIAAAGGAFGPFLGGSLVTLWGWEAVFVGNTVSSLIGLLGTVVWVPRLPGRRDGSFDLIGAVLSVVAVGCLVFLVIEGPRHPLAWSSIGALIGTVVLSVAFIRHEARTPHPLLPLQLFNDRHRVAGAGTLLLASLGFNGIFFVGALLLQLGWGESGLIAGLLLVPVGAIEVIVANLAIKIAGRFGLEATITAGLCCMAAGYVAMGFTPAGDRWWFVSAGLLAGLGNGLTIPLSIDRIMGTVDPAFAGTAAGVNDMAIELGASTGIGLLGTVQAVWFDANRPSDSMVALSDIAEEADRSAFRDASGAAFVVAAIVAVLAIPIARLTRSPAPAPGG